MILIFTQVLAPRYRDYTSSYTRLLKAPSMYAENIHGQSAGRRVLVELKGNPFPNLEYPNTRPNRQGCQIMSELHKLTF
jgi:hypothetical protein